MINKKEWQVVKIFGKKHIVKKSYLKVYKTIGECLALLCIFAELYMLYCILFAVV